MRGLFKLPSHPPEKILLSDIIQRINEVFGENLGEEDRVTLEQIQQRMNSHDEL